MEAGRLRLIDEVFQAAIQQSADRRAAFVSGRCGPDAALRAEVESLLEHHVACGEFLESPATLAAFTANSSAAGGLGDAPTSQLPERIGSYRIRGIIGRGGMGVVYAAEQERPHRSVALKVVRGGLASERLRRRFEVEAELLGRLQHPGIAQIYEAGAAPGPQGPEPYFAMELVKGRPLNEHAALHRLSIRERLTMFVAICEAVNYAHQKGVIHRDLKPDNVLVSDAGDPKILDFGVARATDSDVQFTAQTEVGQIVGTLPYMSPEQVVDDTDAVDTRSDVYSLGVMLYQLLTARLPHELRGRAIPEAVRMIREQEPARPSKHNAALRGDLDTIVIKSLEKDRERRYSTAAALAEDLRRHLSSEPIFARRATAWYQLRKFAGRNRVLVSGAAAVAIALLLGVIGTSMGMFEAIAAQDEAERQAGRATAVSDFLREMLASVRPEAEGHDVTVAEMLDEAAAQLPQRFGEEQETLAALHTTIGESYLGLGRYEQAEDNLTDALELYRALRGDDHRDTLHVRHWLARNLYEQGRFAEAEAAIRSVIADRRRLLGDDDIDTVLSQRVQAMILSGLGRADEAEALYLDAHDKLLELRGSDARPTIDTLIALATVKQGQARYDEAEQLFREALTRLAGQAAPDDVTVLALRNNLGALLTDAGRYAEAEIELRPVYEARLQRYGSDHPLTLHTMNNLARTLEKLRQYDEAELLYRQSLSARRARLGDNHTDTLTAMNNLALLLAARGRNDEAVDLCQETLERRREVLGVGHPNTMRTIGSLGALLSTIDRNDEAIALLSEALPIARTEIGIEHESTLILINVLALAHKRAGEYDPAEALYREALETRTRLSGEEDITTINLINNLGRLFQDQQRYEEAEPFLRRSLELRRRLYEPLDFNLSGAIHNLATLLRNQGNYDESIELLRERLAIEMKHRPEHFERWVALSHLGSTLKLAGHCEEAIQPLRQCTDGLKATLPAGHWFVAANRVLLGDCLLETARLSEAETVLLLALEEATAATSNRRRYQQKSIEALIEVYESSGQHEHAKEFQARLAELASDVLGPEGGVIVKFR